MGFYRGPNIVTDGLVFAVDAGSERSYPGSGTSTSNIINNASGTLTNGVSYTSSNGGAFDFDGTDDFIAFPDDTNLNNQTLTMESWVQLDSTLAQEAFLFEKGQVNTQYSNFVATNSYLYFRTQGLSTVDKALNLASYTSAGLWTHITCTYGAGAKYIYINGVLRSTQTGLTGTIPTNTTGLFLGAYGPGTSYFMDGKIAVSRVYNKALTAAEVLQNFNAQKSRFGL
tara:strand:+ start:682 stop:1362 length:681 start_codon:yes stop_codon:yes gene_type:complete